MSNSKKSYTEKFKKCLVSYLCDDKHERFYTIKKTQYKLFQDTSQRENNNIWK